MMQNSGLGFAHTVGKKKGEYNGKEQLVGIYFGLIIGQMGKKMPNHKFSFLQDTFFKRILESTLESLKQKNYLLPVTGENPQLIVEDFERGLAGIQHHLEVRAESVYDGIEKISFHAYRLN